MLKVVVGVFVVVGSLYANFSAANENACLLEAAQGICENMARAPLDSYHYSTDAGSLTGASASCNQSGGTWQ